MGKKKARVGFDESYRKRSAALGMDTSNAQKKLARLLAFEFLQLKYGTLCWHCNEEVLRSEFSFDHINQWLNSADPVAGYFDLTQIRLSHRHCNILDGQRRAARALFEIRKSRREGETIDEGNTCPHSDGAREDC